MALHTQKKARSRRRPAETITDTDYAEDIAFLSNTPTRAESLLHKLEKLVESIGFHMNADKTENMCFNLEGHISLNSGSLKLVDKFP